MPLSEKVTRKQQIKAALVQAGREPILHLGIEDQRGIVALEEYLADHGPADHALIHREQPFAFVGTIDSASTTRPFERQDSDFGGQLEGLLTEINTSIAQ